ncbi:MAG TPA: RDD family protein [Nitrospiria bacterium]|nr:RDD family protein [Nitrospiria bacterium]
MEQPATASQPASAFGGGTRLFDLKADYLPRLVARIIDLLAAAALAHMAKPVGFFAGLTYLLIADGVMPGRSLGKAVIGLRVVAADGRPAGLRESILRNLPFGVAMLLAAIPWVGWLLAVAVVVLEGLLVVGNDRGRRLGDEAAQTHVVNARSERSIDW